MSLPLKFIWDTGNREHSIKHGLTIEEIESVFADADRTFLPTYGMPYESGHEERFIVVGRSITGLIRTIIFTLRDEEIRVISARGSRKTEKEQYNLKLSK